MKGPTPYLGKGNTCQKVLANFLCVFIDTFKTSASKMSGPDISAPVNMPNCEENSLGGQETQTSSLGGHSAIWL